MSSTMCLSRATIWITSVAPGIVVETKTKEATRGVTSYTASYLRERLQFPTLHHALQINIKLFPQLFVRCSLLPKASLQFPAGLTLRPHST